jgi:hypothetical protein
VSTGGGHTGRMKLSSAVAKSLLMAASIGMVVPLGAQTMPKPKPKTAPATPAAEEPAEITGIEIARKQGGFIGVNVEGIRMVIRFYDAEKKQIPVNVARAAARWNPVTKTGEERTVLNPTADGLTLTSTPVVKPPLVFIAYLTLLDAEGNALESTPVDLRRLNAPPAE